MENPIGFLKRNRKLEKILTMGEKSKRNTRIKIIKHVGASIRRV